MKTRILYNGVQYKVQTKIWWKPFWVDCKGYADYGSAVRYYETYEDAEKRANREIELDLMSKWMVVEKQR